MKRNEQQACIMMSVILLIALLWISFSGCSKELSAHHQCGVVTSTTATTVNVYFKQTNKTQTFSSTGKSVGDVYCENN